VTTEYALVQGRWWMPTLTAVDATMTAGSLASVPARFERSYSEYRVQGDSAAAPGVLAQAPPAAMPIDTPAVCRENEACQCSSGTCRMVEVEVPDDTLALLRSEELPPPLTPGAPLLSGRETDEITSELRRVAETPWIFVRPSFTQAPLLLRYNRVEALSAGTRATVDFGPLQADGTVRVATSNWEPDVEIGVRRESPDRRRGLAPYPRPCPG